MVDVVILVVDLFVDVVAAFVDTGLAGVIIYSGCITIINKPTNFSYRRDIRISRSSLDITLTPTWNICIIKTRYHSHYWMMVKQSSVFFTMNLYINKQVSTCT